MSDILTKPEWIPWYVQRVKGSKAWKELKDFQFGWYVKLLTESADSDTPGYLPSEVSELWQLAGAQTEYFFKKHGGIELLARHFKRTEDGRRIYNERMLEVLHEQGKKLTKRRRRCISSILSSPLALQELPDWIPMKEFKCFMEMREKIHMPLTEHALKLAVSKLETLRDEGNDPAAVLNQSTFNDWKGLFPIQPNRKGNGTSKAQERHDRNNQKYAKVLGLVPQGPRGNLSLGDDGSGVGDVLGLTKVLPAQGCSGSRESPHAQPDRRLDGHSKAP